MKTKICNKCGKEKPLDQFSKGNDKDGLRYWCKECVNRYAKEYCRAHKKDNILWRKTHKKEKKLYDKTYYQKNKEKRKKQKKIWYKNHKKEINEHERNKKKTNINYKLAHYLRTRIWSALKGSSKSQSTMKLIGCSIDFLKKHLESKFKRDMTWNNYGSGWDGRGMQQWHIDHIKPCASFDLSKEEERAKCFNWKNLQPLWAEENISKSDKIKDKEKTI